MTSKSFIKIGFTFVALSVAACNAGPLLKTGSLTPAPAAVPKVSTPIDRALHAGATAARAQKCGFYFDAAALRTKFLEAETARGTTPDVLAKTGQSYDYTANTIASKITNSDVYCSTARTASIKGSLQRGLAGNFEPPPKKVVAQSGGIADFLEGTGTKETFNPGSIYDPILNEPGKKAEEE